ncbi:MAG: glycosyltransferase family 2 protein [Candidatus Gastranaerophilales bacterium]|nr:glycosyltransferase family 2 protein [Candidatus Gastranaerophilales bacterium]
MKLIIQIPCYNEEIALPVTLSQLPKQIEGIDEIEVLIIDDGSNDRTVEIAKEYGVNHIEISTHHRGLAKTFMAGIHRALAEGADIIVNTDADNQYCADDIQKLVMPILEKKADIVIGARPIKDIKEFSPLKKFLQFLGSKVVRLLSSTATDDAPSGFRAFTRDAALALNVFDNYTYTIETVIQSKTKGLHIVSVPIRVNSCFRKSRLVKNIFTYIQKNSFTILRMFIIYRPFRFFATIGGFITLVGVALLSRFLFLYFLDNGAGHIQSLIISSILVITGFQIIIFGVLADLLSINRKLIEDIQIRVKKIENK